MHQSPTTFLACARMCALLCALAPSGGCGDDGGGGGPNPAIHARLRATILAREGEILPRVVSATGARRSGDQWERFCDGQPDGLLVGFGLGAADYCTRDLRLLQPGDPLGIAIEVTVVDEACTKPHGDFSAPLRCGVLANVQVYCGDIRTFAAGDLVLDDAIRVGLVVTRDEAQAWLDANIDNINADIAERFAHRTLGDGLPGDVQVDERHVDVEVVDVATTLRQVARASDPEPSGPVDLVVLYDASAAGGADPDPEGWRAATLGGPLDALGAARVRRFAFNEALGVAAHDALGDLVGQAAGRSNLWAAVRDAYRTLRDEAPAEPDATRAVLALTVGPDSCAGEALGPCETPCATADMAELFAEIGRDRLDADAPRVAVHVIQLGNDDAPAPDPRQMELACMSGGVYRWAAAGDDIPWVFDDVSAALRGRWEAALDVPALVSDGSDGFARGAVSVVEGAVRLGATREIRFVERLRRPCLAADECGGVEGACRVACSAETRTCAGADVFAADFTACMGDQGEGICCAGVCTRGDTCDVCD